ncbi:MAG: hypothetical protein JNL12_20055 [Planctomycetes bacterium]|nr:hypothetical protein [Planctomycetota bacterium]
MVHLEQLLRFGCALWLCSAHLYTSARLAWWLGGGRSLFVGGATLLAVALALATISFHLLIATGTYTPLGASLLGAVECALAAFATRRLGSTAVVLARFRRAIARVVAKARTSPHRGRIGFFVVTTVLVSCRCVLYVPNTFDTVVYHGTRAAMWLQEGHLGAMWGAGPWELYGVFPGGSELFTSLAMLPFHHDLLAAFVDQGMWFGLGVAVWALLRELGVKEPNGSVAAAFVLGVPTLRLLTGSCYVEPTLCLCLALGVFFTLRLWRTGEAAAALLAIGSYGIAASTKFSVMGTAATGGVLAVLGCVLGRAPRGRALAFAAGGVVLALVATGPWLLNALRLTGYPFSPMPLQVGGVTLGVSRLLERFMASAMAPEAFVWANEWPLLQHTFRLPVGPTLESVGVFVALPLLLAPVGLVVLLRRRRFAAAATFVVLLAVAVAAYLSPSMWQVRYGWPFSYSRFLLPIVVLAVPVAAVVGNARAGRWSLVGRFLWAGFFVNTLVFGFPWLHADEFWGIALLVLVACGWCAVAGALRARVGSASRAVVHLGLTVLVGFGLLHWKDSVRATALREGVVLHPFERGYLPMAIELDRETERQRRIAITSGPSLPNPTLPNMWPSYHYLGRRLQNRLVYVSPLPDGRVPIYYPSDGWEAQADFETWYRRLVELGVTDVLAQPPVSIELQWMLQHPERFEGAADAAGEGGLFRLRAK